MNDLCRLLRPAEQQQMANPVEIYDADASPDGKFRTGGLGTQVTTPPKLAEFAQHGSLTANLQGTARHASLCRSCSTLDI
jgi:hypothetical protein